MKFKIPYTRYVIQVRKESSVKRANPAPSPSVVIDIKRTYNKVFCIGIGKTGTSSLEKLLRSFGFRMGNQAVGEVLSEDWTVHGRSDRIIRFCYTADAFQDSPFNRRGLYKLLDKEFPGSKFILSVRNSPEEWFDSMVRFHTKLFSSDKSRPPDEEDKRNALYRYKGFMLDSARNHWDYPNVPMYHEETYKAKYIQYNEEVRQYFSGRTDDFIEINLAKKEDFKRLCDFLHIKTTLTDFPWENKT